MLILLFALAAPLHLADLLKEAREKNPELLSAQTRAKAAAASVAPAGALEDPQLMIQLWNAPLDFSNVPVMVQVSQALPLGGKRGARRDAAAADEQVAKASALVQLNDLEVQVAQAYFELFLAERTQEVDTELDPLLQALLQTAEARVSTGKGETVEVLRAQGAIIQLRSDRETANDHRSSSWARLAALLDRDPTGPVGTTTIPGTLATLPPQAALRDRAMRERPELQSARAMVQGAEAQARLAQAASVPDIAPFLGLMHTFRGTGETNFLFAGVQGNLPIFAGRNDSRSAAASSQTQALRESEHAARNRVGAEVAEVYAHLLAEDHQIALHHQLIPLARQAVDSAEHSYTAGRSDFTMVLDSVRELRLQELELAQHLALYEQRLADLQRAVGADLGLSQAAEAGHADAH